MPTVCQRAARAALLSAAGFAALACKSQPAPVAPPPTEVTVHRGRPRRLDQVYEFAGSVEASKSIQVRSQVAGVVKARPSTRVRRVKAGDVLTKSTRRPSSRLARRAGAAHRSGGAGHQRQADAHPFTALVSDTRDLPPGFRQRRGQAKQADAAVEEARGVLDRAKKNRDDTKVRAEVPGRVGRRCSKSAPGARHRRRAHLHRRPGSHLRGVPPSAQQQLSWRRDRGTARMLTPGGGLTFQAILPDGRPAPSPGGSTSSTRSWIRPPNPAVPRRVSQSRSAAGAGQFVRVRLLGLIRDSAIVVPQRACSSCSAARPST
jgi:membrane fusion protein (multidrug efflux system)